MGKFKSQHNKLKYIWNLSKKTSNESNIEKKKKAYNENDLLQKNKSDYYIYNFIDFTTDFEYMNLVEIDSYNEAQHIQFQIRINSIHKNNISGLEVEPLFKAGGEYDYIPEYLEIIKNITRLKKTGEVLEENTNYIDILLNVGVLIESLSFLSDEYIAPQFQCKLLCKLYPINIEMN